MNAAPDPWLVITANSIADTTRPVGHLDHEQRLGPEEHPRDIHEQVGGQCEPNAVPGPCGIAVHARSPADPSLRSEIETVQAAEQHGQHQVDVGARLAAAVTAS
jgi:hypothetical protein